MYKPAQMSWLTPSLTPEVYTSWAIFPSFVGNTWSQWREPVVGGIQETNWVGGPAEAVSQREKMKKEKHLQKGDYGFVGRAPSAGNFFSAWHEADDVLVEEVGL